MTSESRTLLGHPVGLFVLFFAEMWERFSFYGMRALLTLYMTKALLYSNEQAFGTYAAYIGFVYATPLFGGMLADRLLGQRRAIVLGGILMCIGHFAMAIEHHLFFYGAMALIIAGNGFFKPNISTIVGSLYPKDDPRRDSAFTIFYMGINLGAAGASIICGLVGEKIGWHYGFGLAGIGMIFGLTVFVWGGKYLGEAGFPPDRKALATPMFGGLSKMWAVYLGVIAFVPFAAYMLTKPIWVENGVTYAVGPLVLLYILFEAWRSSRVEAHRLLAIVVLIFFSIAFWTAFEQAGSSMTVFADEHVERTLLGIEVPASVLQAANPIFILLMAPVFSWLWLKLERIGKVPSSPMKFGLALIQLAAGFGALVIGAQQAATNGTSSLGWLILAYYLHTTGELCLSPVGLSTVTRLAPSRLVGVMMGMWFMSNAFAGVFSGIVAKATSGDAGYETVFANVAYIAAGAGLLIVLLTPLLKKMEHRGE